MTTQQLVRASLSSARKELSQTLPRLTDEILDWAPVPGMHTLHRIFMDILTTEVSILQRLRGLPRSTDDELDAPFLAAKSIKHLPQQLKQVRTATLQYLDGLDEQQLSAPAKISEAFSAELDLNPTPVSEVLRYIARHEAYHAGQVVTYLWAHGDDPYAWD